MPLALVLPLPASVAVRLALPADVPGALLAEDLHLTLVVLVDGAAPRLADVRTLAAELAPIDATLSGLGRFSGDEADAFHATVDGPTLPALRARVEALLGDRLDPTHGFDPHVTLAYLAADAPAPLARLAPPPVTFDALSLWDGATRTTFPLTAPTMTTATLDAIALPQDPPTELRLFRDGWNATVKGRFLLDAQGAAEILRRFAEHGVELAMDFDHATFGAPGPKRDVPGYIAALDYRPGDGLYATGLRWTAVGLAAITPGRAPDGTPTVPEYRYLSPAVDFDADSRRVVGLRPVALVTYPATHGQAPLVMSAGATSPETRTMKNVLALLGLAADADEPAVVAALQTVRRERDALLGALDAPDLASALGTATALRTARIALDAAERRATDAEGRIEAAERREVLAAGRTEGKLTPALVTHFSDKPVAEIRAYLAAAPVIAALAPRPGGSTPQPSAAGAPTALSGVPDGPFEKLSALEKDRLLKGNRLAFEQRLTDFETRGGDGARYRAALARVTG